MFGVGSILCSTATGQRFRVIGIVNSIVSLIEMDINTNNIIFLAYEDIVKLLANEEYELEENNNSVVIDRDKLPDKVRSMFDTKCNVVREIYNTYAPSFEGLAGNKSKPEAMAIMYKYGMKKMTFLSTIRVYLQSGFDENALVDGRYLVKHRSEYKYKKKPGKPSKYVESGIVVTDKVREHFAVALEYYKSGRAKSYKKAFDYMNNLFYCETVMIDGKAMYQLVSADRRPTEQQFADYYRSHITKEEKDAIKTSKAEQRNNRRVLLSDSMDGVTGPGSLVEIDACEADCSIVSSFDTSKTIGRPVVYFMIDVYSRMIIAVSIGFENNDILAFTNLMLNLSDNKHDYCKRFGIDFTDDRLWPSQFIPDSIRVDRGAEWKSKEVERICGALNIEKMLVTGATGSLKPIVEQSFHQMHSQLNTHLEDNGLIEKRYDSNHHAEATLTIEEYTKLVINFVLAHNQNPLDTYRRTKEMKEQKVNPVPAELWVYGVKKYGARRPIINLKQYFYELMLPINAKYSRQGICFKKLYYLPDNDNSMMAKFYNAGNKKMDIEMRIDPRDVGRLYYMSDNELKSCRLSAKGDSISYAGMTLKMYGDYLKGDAEVKAKCLVMKENIGCMLFSNLENIVQDAKQHKTVNDTTDIVAEREKNKQLKSHENSIAGRLEEKTVPALPEAKPETEAEEKPEDNGYHGYMSFQEALEDF